MSVDLEIGTHLLLGYQNLMIITGSLVAGFLIFVVYFGIRELLIAVTVENQSMWPTLLDGDRVLVLRYWPARWLRRGHIVLVWPWPHEVSDGPKPFGVIPFIKRIRALPGDLLVTHISELDELHKHRMQFLHGKDGTREWLIPAKHFFVRGDHPIGGFDSLSWGPIPYESLLGLVIMRLPGRRPETNA